MSMPDPARLLLLMALLPALPSQAAGLPAQGSPQLGTRVDPGLAQRWEISVFPDGTGLPPGRGDVATGEELYRRRCLSCHGPNGEGATADELAGGEHGLTGIPPDKTIGTYWPYATTLFDFIRRAMPMDAPWSLSADEVYALCAYLLHLNGILPADAVLDQESLPGVEMPNRHGFISWWPHPPSGD
ncbi:MAG: cytochrome c [Gammaproteobacteria bacterium]|nr:MAG: cytochrome c [Gammaproteobacteria bacterium]